MSDGRTHTSLPSLLDIEASVYHNDELDDTRPSLSKSIIQPKRKYERKPGSRPVGRPPRPAIDRFTERYEIDEESGCWIWMGAKDPDGYATFFEGSGVGFEQRAHRFAYKHFVGAVPKGLVLDHLCRVRHCVNPEHLEPVTNRENILRGRRPLGERTHCKHGHEFNEANTYVPTNGIGRVCRRCHADQMQRARDRKKAAA